MLFVLFLVVFNYIKVFYFTIATTITVVIGSAHEITSKIYGEERST